MADHRNKNAILGFHGKTDIDRTGMDDPVADESSRRRRHLGKPDGKGTKRIECRAGLDGLFAAVGEKGVELDGQDDGGERAGPTAAHRVGHGDAHRGSGGDGVALEVLKETFQIVDRDASSGAAAGHTGQIRGMEAEFRHPRLHAGREEAGAAGVGGNRQSAHGGLDGFFTRPEPPAPEVPVAFVRFGFSTGGGGASWRPSRSASSSLISRYPRVAPTA